MQAPGELSRGYWLRAVVGGAAAALGWAMAGAMAGMAMAGMAMGSAAAADAAPAPHPIELRWEAPAGCPQGGEVLSEVDRLLGGRPAGEGRMVVDAQVRGAEGAYRLDMSIRDNAGEGERELRAGRCDELVDAAALIVALAFDPEAVAETQRREAAAGVGGEEGGAREVGIGEAAGPPALAPVSPPPATEQTPPPAPVLPGVAVGYYPPRRSADERAWVSLALRTSVDVGALPAPALGLGGTVAVRFDPLLVRARGGFFFGADETLPERPETGGAFDLWALAPGLCLTPWHSAAVGRRRSGDLYLDLCAEMELGAMHGVGFGVRRPDEGSAVWVTPMVGAQGELSLHRWLALRLTLDAGAPILRPDFVLTQVGIVHTASAVIGRGGLELGAVF